jgi:lysyl-tRNA synthetase class 2
MDRNHNPEFTMLEFYWAYADYNDLMKLVECMYHNVSLGVLNTGQLEREGRRISLEPPFKRSRYFEALKDYLGEDVFEYDGPQLAKLAQQRGLPIGTMQGRGPLLDLLSKEIVEPKLIEPTFLYDYPVELSPLAKRHRTEPRLAERFELFIDGFEFGNGFSELNDPADQRERFEAQHSLREKGDEEAHPIDEDFIFALEHGMPPTAGYGLGVDRLVMLLTGCHSIRDVVFFPIMKPESSAATSAEGDDN